jgi:hypothetical protein
VLPGPAIHADFTALAAFALTHKHTAACGIEITLSEGERLTDSQPGTPQQHNKRSRSQPVGVSPAHRMTATISSTLGGSAG